MRPSLIATTVVATALLTLSVDAAFEDDEFMIPFGRAPAAVRATIEAHAGSGVRELEVELEDGVLIYEAEWDDREIEVAEDGQLLSIEQDLARDQVPVAVIHAVGAALPGGLASEWSHSLVAVYEVEVASGGVSYTLVVSPAGEILESTSDINSGED